MIFCFKYMFVGPVPSLKSAWSLLLMLEHHPHPQTREVSSKALLVREPWRSIYHSPQQDQKGKTWEVGPRTSESRLLPTWHDFRSSQKILCLHETIYQIPCWRFPCEKPYTGSLVFMNSFTRYTFAYVIPSACIALSPTKYPLIIQTQLRYSLIEVFPTSPLSLPCCFYELYIFFTILYTELKYKKNQVTWPKDIRV